MLYHVSLFPVKQFYPRVPIARCLGEDDVIPRISFSEYSELEAIRAVPQAERNIQTLLDLGIEPTLYVYALAEKLCTVVDSPFEKAKGLRLFYCTEEYVPDTELTGECWLLDTPNMSDIICRTFRITDIAFDMLDEDVQRIESIGLVPCSDAEDNLEQLFKHFHCKVKPDDPNLSKFNYPGNENSFLTHVLEVLRDIDALLYSHILI